MAHLRRVLVLAAAHFALSLASAIVAEGWDLDQLRSRSRLSTIAGVVHDGLMYPHDVAMRALPSRVLAGRTPLIPLAIVLNSLLWGTAGYAVWRGLLAFGRHREQS